MKNPTKRKQVTLLFFFFSLLILLFFTCSNYAGENETVTGFIKITVGGGNSASRSTTGYPPSDNPDGFGDPFGPALAQLTYQVFFNGNEATGTQTTNAQGNHEIQFTLNVGTYSVRIESYEPSGPGGSPSLYAVGKASNVQVQGGLTTTVPISMYQALTVTFDINDTYPTPNPYATVQAGQGDIISEPSTPSLTNFIFDGWYKETGCTTLYNFLTETVTADISLYAKWIQHTVTTAAIPGVTAPATGFTPVSAITETAQYTGTVSWNGSPSTFAYNTSYTATITLTAKAGYTLQGVTANFFTVAGATTVSNSVNSGVVTAVFPVTPVLSPGDTGPGGGKIFYYDRAGFTMTDNSQMCHYLEAALADMSFLQWESNFGYTDVSGTGTAIGTGRENTALILAAVPVANAPAAEACDDYSNNGKTDWFLPSKDELNELYTNRTSVGNMGTGRYWSSSQFATGQVRYHDFNNGDNTSTAYTNNDFTVRAIRVF
jgi:uncharacterized repeat protein (TIGR02543 family)